jgi:hypothetical protein
MENKVEEQEIIDTMSDEELNRRLAVNLSRKARIGDALCKGGVPTDPKEIRLYLDVTRDEEATMLEMKKQRAEESRNESDDEYKATILEVLRETKRKRKDVEVIEKIPDEIASKIKYLETELNQEKETLDLADFVED